MHCSVEILVPVGCGSTQVTGGQCWLSLLRSTAVLFDSIVHVSMSRGNSSLLKERSVSLNLVSSDVKILAFMTKFLSLKTDTGLEVRRGFRMWNSNFAKPASCNEVCSVKLVASRLALCGDWFELFWRRYCCLRVCVCCSVMIAALPVLRVRYVLA